MEVLVHLASRPGEVVSRQELLDQVWGETVVQEEALTQAVSQLRRVLGDDPRRGNIIATVPKRGYRLRAEVKSLDPGQSRPAGGRSVARILPGAGLVLIAAAIWWLWPSPDLVPDLLTATPLTSLPGEEGQAAVSPDGGLVVFTHRPEASDAFKLHLKRIGDAAAAPLTSEPGQEFHPCWSPDNERIAFERRVDSARRVCIVAAIGGPVQELGPVHWRMGGLDWSPDGRFIVYSAKNKQEAPMRLLRLEVATGALDTLTSPEGLSRGDTYPRYAPDGSRLALVRSDRGISRAIQLMPATGGDVSRLSGDFFSCGGMDWTPDGKSLVVSAALQGTFELWQVDLRSGAMNALPTRIHRSLAPSWSTAGAPLVFTDNTLDADLMLGRLDEVGQTTVANSTRLEMTGRIAPDGRTLLLTSDRSGSRELWLFDRETGAVRQLTDFAGAALRKPLWSPDGKRIAVNIGREGLLQIVVIDVATGLQRQVTSAAIHHRLGHWSADSRYVYYSREEGADWQISRIRIDGTAAVDLPIPGCASLSEEPDGSILYFKETEDGLFRGTGRDDEQVVAAPDDLHDLQNLQLTDDGYWFIHFTADGAQLAFCTFTTGEIVDRALLQGRPTGEFHVGPNGRDFVYTSVVRTGNDLVIVRNPR